MKNPSLRYVVLSLALTLGGCSDNSDPVRPAPVTPPTVQYLDFSITPEIGRPNAVNFVAVGGTLADRFQIEVGSTSGASDLGVFSFGAQKDNTFTWTPAPVGTLFARARAENAAGSSPWTQETKMLSVDPRHVIDALFLGQGPLQADVPGCYQGGGAMKGWPPGTSISILVSSSLTEAQFAQVQRFASQLPVVTQGTLRATVRRSSQAGPTTEGDNEITIAVLPEQQVTAQCRGYSACAYGILSGHFLDHVSILVKEGVLADNAWILPHELGHAALGLCHMHGPDGLKPASIMTGSGLFNRPDEMEPMTLKAVEAVHKAGLTPGANRAQFVAAGLVDPNAPGRAAAASTRDSHGEEVVVEERGGVVEIFRPLCVATK